MCADESQDLFDRLKHMMIKLMALAYPDTKEEYKIYTDASNIAIEPCLTQQIYNAEMKRTMEKSVYFISYKVGDTQMRWKLLIQKYKPFSTPLKKLHHYLHCRERNIYTEHKPLQYILNSPIQNQKNPAVGFVYSRLKLYNRVLTK